MFMCWLYFVFFFRDVFRRLFGQPSEQDASLKVCILKPNVLIYHFDHLKTTLYVFPEKWIVNVVYRMKATNYSILSSQEKNV